MRDRHAGDRRPPNVVVGNRRMNPRPGQHPRSGDAPASGPGGQAARSHRPARNDDERMPRPYRQRGRPWHSGSPTSGWPCRRTRDRLPIRKRPGAAGRGPAAARRQGRRELGPAPARQPPAGSSAATPPRTSPASGCRAASTTATLPSSTRFEPPAIGPAAGYDQAGLARDLGIEPGDLRPAPRVGLRGRLHRQLLAGRRPWNGCDRSGRCGSRRKG